MVQVNKNAPALRFPEFTDEWMMKKLGEVLTFGNGKDYRHLEMGDIPVFGTGGLMTTVDTYLYDGETVCIGRKGTIDKPMYFNGKIWVVDTLFYTHSFKGLSPKFGYNIFQKINWKKHNEASGVPSLSKSTIETITINLPTLPEQQKIGNFFAAIDSKLTDLKTKHRLLEAYKKGVMQQLFAQKLRFQQADGSDFADWTLRKLGEVCEIIGGGTPETNKEEYWNGNIQWFTPTEIKSNFVSKSSRTITELGLAKSSAKKLPIGTILLTTRATIGEAAIATEVCTTNQGFQSLIMRKGYHNVFVFYWLQKNKYELTSRANGSTFPEISKSAIEKIKITIPCLAEQTLIAHYLSAVDAKIECVKAQIEQMSAWKKGLLQQMFV